MTEHKTHWIVFSLFLFYTGSWYIHASARLDWLGDTQYYIGLFLASVAVFNFIFRPDHYFPLSNYYLRRVYVVIFLLFLNLLIMTMYSSAEQAWFAFWEDIVKYFLFGCMIIGCIKNTRELLFFFCVWLLVFSKIIQESLWGIFSGGLLWENQGILRIHGSVPQYRHPNSLGGYLVSGIPFVCALYMLSKSVFRPFIVLLIFLILIAVSTTGSRTSYVSLILTVVFFLWQTKQLFRFKYLFFIGVSIVFLLTILPNSQDYVDRFLSTFTLEDKEGKSIEKRLTIWSDAKEIISDSPLGVGTKAFTELRLLRFGANQGAHSLYLEIWTEFGIQGLCLFLLMVYLLFRALTVNRAYLEAYINHLTQIKESQLTNSYHQKNSPIIEELALLKRIYYFAFAVEYFLVIRLFLGIWGDDFYEIYWWFIFGLTVVTIRLTEQMIQSSSYQNQFEKIKL